MQPVAVECQIGHGDIWAQSSIVRVHQKMQHAQSYDRLDGLDYSWLRDSHIVEKVDLPGFRPIDPEILLSLCCQI